MKRARRWALLPLLLFLLLAVLLGVGLLTSSRERPSAQLKKAFPDFRLATLADPHRVWERAQLVGQVTLVNVWGSWCVNCEAEFPALLQLHRKGVRIVGINYQDERSAANAFLSRHDDPYVTTLVDEEGTLSFDLGVYGAPESFILDRKGIIRYHHTGVIDASLIERQLEPLLEELDHEQ